MKKKLWLGIGAITSILGVAIYTGNSRIHYQWLAQAGMIDVPKQECTLVCPSTPMVIAHAGRGDQ